MYRYENSTYQQETRVAIGMSDGISSPTAYLGFVTGISISVVLAASEAINCNECLDGFKA